MAHGVDIDVDVPALSTDVADGIAIAASDLQRPSERTMYNCDNQLR